MADSAGAPIKFPIAPVRAMELAMEYAGITVADLARVEVNEAFAVVALACQQLLSIPDEIYNPNGGAVSLGHPIGASGARLVGTMAHTMEKGQLGLTGICNGGGGASAVLIEKLTPILTMNAALGPLSLSRHTMAAAIPEEDEEELHFEDAFTIYGHPSVKDVLASFGQCNYTYCRALGHSKSNNSLPNYKSYPI
eukprot:sb/3470935/